MRTSSVIAASAAFVAGANAWGNVTYTTEVVTAYTTYCPSSTQVVHGTKTYTVTSATTLVITDCPCTVTKPIITKPVVYCSSCPETSSSVVVPVESSSIPVVYTSSAVISASVPIIYTSSAVVSPSVPIGTVPAGSSSVPVPVTSKPPPPVGTGVPSSPSQGPNPNSPPIFHNSTIAVPPAPAGTSPAGGAPPAAGSATPTGPAAFTGAANKAFAASGAGLVGVLALFACLL